jgi:REP element-mobilizing transposase RayT
MKRENQRDGGIEVVQFLVHPRHVHCLHPYHSQCHTSVMLARVHGRPYMLSRLPPRETPLPN